MKESERVKDLCAKYWEWSTYLEWHMDSHNKDTKTPL